MKSSLSSEKKTTLCFETSILRDCDKRTVLIPFMLLQIYSPEAVNNIPITL